MNKAEKNATAVVGSATVPEELDLSDLLPRLKDQGYAADRVARRRQWLEEKTGATLSHIAKCSFDSEELRNNVENPKFTSTWRPT